MLVRELRLAPKSRDRAAKGYALAQRSVYSTIFVRFRRKSANIVRLESGGRRL